jgi:hypothetical protein
MVRRLAAAAAKTSPQPRSIISLEEIIFLAEMGRDEIR